MSKNMRLSSQAWYCTNAHRAPNAKSPPSRKWITGDIITIGCATQLCQEVRVRAAMELHEAKEIESVSHAHLLFW